MSSYVGVVVSDPWLHSQFTQVELRTLKSKFNSNKTLLDRFTVGDLPPVLAKLNAFSGTFDEDEIKSVLDKSYSNTSDQEVDFETFLRAYLSVQARGVEKSGGSKASSSSFLKTSTTTVHHAINESEKASYVSHVNSYLRDDPFLKSYLPIDPATNAFFDLVKDGVLLCKLINLAVPGTIDERAINTKKILNPWERNENLTLGLNSAKAIGCTVVNIGTQDIAEGRPYLVLGLISQIIKIQMLADLNFKKTPSLFQLVDDTQDAEELMGLAPEKVLLKWMNFHLKKAGYEKQVTNFSSDVKDGEAYAYLLNALAPEHSSHVALETKDPTERAKKVLEQAEKMDCKRYLSPKDIVDGSANLNLAFVAQIFQHRNGLTDDSSKSTSFAEMMTDDVETSREERCFRLWINSLGTATYVNNVFEDLRNGWVLLEVLDKVSPGSVNWKHANKPPIKMPFKKVENCNEVVKIGKELRFSLVNVAGNDIVQGNKKLLLAFLWQLMRYTMLQLLKNLRSHSQGKEITDADILYWANRKVKRVGRTSQAESFRDKNLSSGIFFLELLTAVEPRVVNWSLVTSGETEEDKKLNATYIISVARKLGCSIFLLPEDIIEVNQKMMLILAASIMYWSLQQQSDTESNVSEDATDEGDANSVTGEISNLSLDEASESSPIVQDQELLTKADEDKDEVDGDGENNNDFFSLCCSYNMRTHKPHKKVATTSTPFVIPGLPGDIVITAEQANVADEETPMGKFMKEVRESESISFGVLVNSFYELESTYADFYRSFVAKRAWHIGPLSLSNTEIAEKAGRGKKASIDERECLQWLDSKTPGSVVYMSFGSGTNFTNEQLLEIAAGLEGSGQNFIWVVRKNNNKGENEEWLPEGFEERTKGKGLIIRGWAPQVLILDHKAVGGFVTHCGWNSAIEGIAAGLPMVTWPMGAEQFYNEKLLTKVLKTGVNVGATELVKKGKLISREEVEKAVREVIVGEEAEERRERAKKLGEMAKAAVEEGGSSFKDLNKFMEEVNGRK